MVTLTVTLELACYALLGFLLVKLQILDKSFSKQLSTFIMDVVLPCLIIRIISGQTFEGNLGALALIFALALAYLLASFLLGQVFFLAMGRSETGRLARFSSIFSNFTYMGNPVVEGLYGSAGLFPYVMFCIPLRVFFYGSTRYLLSSQPVREQLPLKTRLKNFFSPTMTAVFIGLFLFFTGLGLPAFLENTLETMKISCTPLGMIVCGMSVSDTRFRDILRNRRALGIALIKNILAPLFILLLVLWLPLDPILKKIAVISAALPIPSLVTTFSIKYKMSEPASRDASVAMFASTLLSIALLPVWALLLDALMK